MRRIYSNWVRHWSSTDTRFSTSEWSTKVAAWATGSMLIHPIWISTAEANVRIRQKPLTQSQVCKNFKQRILARRNYKIQRTKQCEVRPDFDVSFAVKFLHTNLAVYNFLIVTAAHTETADHHEKENEVGECRNATFNKRYNLMCTVFDLFFLNRYRKLGTHFITKSKLAQEFLESKGIKASNVKAIGVGIDTQMLSNGKTECNEPLFLKMCKDEKVKLLYIGRFEERRNITFIFDIFAEILKKGVNATLYMIGTGDKDYTEKCWKYGNRTIAKNKDSKEKLSVTFWNLYYFQLMSSTIVLIAYVIYLISAGIDNYGLVSLCQIPYMLSSVFEVSWFFYGMENFKGIVTRNAVVKILTTIAVFIFVKGRGDAWQGRLQGCS